MNKVFTIAICLLSCYTSISATMPELAIFAGKKKTIPISLPELKGQPFAWILKFEHRSLNSGHGIVDINGNAQVDLAVPKIKAGLIMNAVLEAGSGNQKISGRIRIYHPNPFAEKKGLITRIYLWDANTHSPLGEMFKQFNVPFTTTHTPEVANKKNVLIISNIKLSDHPGISKILMDKCRKGSKIICFLPKKSSANFPGAFIKEITIDKNPGNSDDKLQFQQKDDLTISNKQTDAGCSGLILSIPPGKIYFYPINRISTMQNAPHELYSFANILLINSTKKEKKNVQ
jgi:hypothetical protein